MVVFSHEDELEILTFFALLVRDSAAFDQTNTFYYVSATGNDSNVGTQAASWRSVQHAADTARSGTANVRCGIYEELVSINVSGNASDGAITFKSYPGETAVLDATHFTPSGRQGVLTIHNQSYIRIEDVEIRNFHTAEHRLAPLLPEAIGGFMHNSDVTCRAFMKLTAATGASLTMPSLGQAAVSPSDKMIGIQIGAISFVDEGTEKVLDILQERGGVNTLFLAVFTYGRGIAGRQIPGYPLPDHGKQIYDLN